MFGSDRMIYTNARVRDESSGVGLLRKKLGVGVNVVEVREESEGCLKWSETPARVQKVWERVCSRQMRRQLTFDVRAQRNV